MFNQIDFETVKPYFTSDDVNWYPDPFFMKYLRNEQAPNLPVIDNLGCFVVKGKDYVDYVLINTKQDVISNYPYTTNGFEQMQAKINIIKVSKHFDDVEK